jgi:hypothetical protein
MRMFVGGVEVEEHAPLTDAEPVKSFPVGQLFYIPFACLPVLCERKQNAHRGLAVDPPEVGAGGQLPNESSLHKALLV